jgi:hypothetical protein
MVLDSLCDENRSPPQFREFSSLSRLNSNTVVNLATEIVETLETHAWYSEQMCERT